MKKNYYMVLIALFTLALNAFSQEGQWETVAAPSGTEAQSEDYNMVITLPDGTTVTVSTDDVDDIQFSNGQISVSGTSIQLLLKAVWDLQATGAATQNKVETLQASCNQLIYELDDIIKDLLNREATLEDITNRQQVEIDRQQVEIDRQHQVIDIQHQDIEDQKNRVNVVESVIEKIETQQATLANQINAQQDDVYTLYERVSKMEVMIPKQNMDITYLAQYTNEQQLQIEQLKAIIATLEKEVAELKNK